jgi:hypothetical protein
MERSNIIHKFLKENMKTQYIFLKFTKNIVKKFILQHLYYNKLNFFFSVCPLKSYKHIYIQLHHN